MKQEFFFRSASGMDQLHAIRWCPEGDVKAVLQIVHGMAEHIDRYDEFARYLAQRGVLVVGHSHLGHGRSAASAAELGYFAERDGCGCVLADIHSLRQMTAAEHPGVPYYILGHSMGSFLTRLYLTDHVSGLAGAVIMGTGDMPLPVLKLAKGVCLLLAKVRGWRHRSGLVNSMVVGGYEKKLGLGWLSKNEENVARYQADPLCGFCFTLNGFYGLFTAFHGAVSREMAGQVPKEIPILFVSGSEDPVGDCGKGVASVYRRYCDHGSAAQMKLYEGDRHEILHEDDRQNVFTDIVRWMGIGESANGCTNPADS